MEHVAPRLEKQIDECCIEKEHIKTACGQIAGFVF
jgi:hypothetical protein